MERRNTGGLLNLPVRISRHGDSLSHHDKEAWGDGSLKGKNVNEKIKIMNAKQTKAVNEKPKS